MRTVARGRHALTEDAIAQRGTAFAVARARAAVAAARADGCIGGRVREAAVTPDAAADASGDANDAGVPGALFFDGVDDVVYATAADGGANETAFTAEAWFKTTTATGTLFEVDGSGADRFLFLLAGKVCFYTYGPGQSVCSTLATYNDGTWHHAAGTLGAVAGQSVYVDGALVGQDLARTASTFTQDNAFAIGRGHTGFLSAVNYYHGRIDEVRVWRVERTGAQIAASRNQNISGATTGLQGYWKFDETGSTATATDATGAHTGGLSGFSFTPSPWQGPGAF